MTYDSLDAFFIPLLRRWRDNKGRGCDTPKEKREMIGMSFVPFVVLLGIAVIVAVIFQFALSYHFLSGPDVAYAKLALAWFGGWLGVPVFGHWWFTIGGVYVVPAFIGAVTAVVLNGVFWKAITKANAPQPVAGQMGSGLNRAA
jgi:hypothetical protein